MKDDPKHIYSEELLSKINKSLQNEENDPMLRRQNDKIKAMRDEFDDIRLKYLRIPIVDTATTQIFKYFEQSCRFIQSAIDSKSKILIHCRHGQSRSASIMAAWLILNNRMSVEEALKFIKSKRPRISPNDGFVAQLNEWFAHCNLDKMNDKVLFVDNAKKSDSSYYLYPSTNKEEAQRYQPQRVQGASVWNTGATMETFDYSEWMKQRIESLLMSLEFHNGKIKITEVMRCDGFATILLTRKEYKYGFDFWFDCKWKGIVDAVECEGTLRMDDVASDEAEDEWIYQIGIDEQTNANEAAMEIMNESKAIVVAAISVFVDEFYRLKSS